MNKNTHESQAHCHKKQQNAKNLTNENKGHKTFSHHVHSQGFSYMWRFCYVNNEKLARTTIAHRASLSAVCVCVCVCVCVLDCLSGKLQWPELWLWEGEGGREDVSNGIFLSHKLFLWSTLNFQSLNWVCAPHTACWCLLEQTHSDMGRGQRVYFTWTQTGQTVGEELFRRFISFNDDKLCISYFTFFYFLSFVWVVFHRLNTFYCISLVSIIHLLCPADPRNLWKKKSVRASIKRNTRSFSFAHYLEHRSFCRSAKQFGSVENIPGIYLVLSHFVLPFAKLCC